MEKCILRWLVSMSEHIFYLSFSTTHVAIPFHIDASRFTAVYTEMYPTLESDCTLKGQATIIKARIALMWNTAAYLFYTDSGQIQLWE